MSEHVDRLRVAGQAGEDHVVGKQRRVVDVGARALGVGERSERVTVDVAGSQGVRAGGVVGRVADVDADGEVRNILQVIDDDAVVLVGNASQIDGPVRLGAAPVGVHQNLILPQSIAPLSGGELDITTQRERGRHAMVIH